jgi:hypothetical protein
LPKRARKPFRLLYRDGNSHGNSMFSVCGACGNGMGRLRRISSHTFYVILGVCDARRVIIQKHRQIFDGHVMKGVCGARVLTMCIANALIEICHEGLCGARVNDYVVLRFIRRPENPFVRLKYPSFLRGENAERECRRTSIGESTCNNSPRGFCLKAVS